MTIEHLVEYFKRITGLTPIPTQIEILKALEDTTIKNLALNCGRGYSKSMLCAVASLWYADVYADSIGRPIAVLLVSGQDSIYQHIDNMFHDNDDLKQKLVQSGIVREVPREGFRLKNRSTVETIIPTGRRVRGSRADILIIDEAFMIKDSVIKDACLPVLTGNISKVVLISTPSSDTGYFIEAITNTKLGYKVMQFSSELCPWQEESNKRLRRTLTPEAYAREVQGRLPSKAERSYFSRKAIDKCFIECEAHKENRPDSYLEIGIDLGYGEPNVTCLTVVEKRRSSNKIKVIYQQTWKGFNAEDISKVCKEYNPRIVKCDSLPKELFDSLKSYYPRLVSIESRVYKDDMLTQTQSSIRTSELIIPKPEFMKLYNELIRYRPHKRAGDNRVDSLSLAIFRLPFEIKETPKFVHFPKKPYISFSNNSRR